MSRRPASEEDRLLVLIPAFHEAERIAAVLKEVAAAIEGPHEVVVIDDGSTDGTAEAARRAGATVLELPFNLGYGAALQTGYKYALERRAKRIVQMDADGQHRGEDIRTLLEPIVAGEADLVIGSRFLEPDAYTMGPLRSLGRRLFGALASLSGLAVTDATSGFQALDARVLELYSGGFFPSDYPDVDVLLRAHRAGLRIVERPVRMRHEVRPSTLHGGWRSVYYLYRLALSLWAGTPIRRRGREPSRSSEAPCNESKS